MKWKRLDYDARAFSGLLCLLFVCGCAQARHDTRGDVPSRSAQETHRPSNVLSDSERKDPDSSRTPQNSNATPPPNSTATHELGSIELARADAADTPLNRSPIQAASRQSLDHETGIFSDRGAETNVPAAADSALLRRIVDDARVLYFQHDQFTCTVTRREKVRRRVFPEETMFMHFRRQPRSVFYRWLDAKNEGRECIFVDGQNEGKIVTRGGRGDLFFAGKVIRVDPDGFLARCRSRYSIRESGLDKQLDRLHHKLSMREHNDKSAGTTRYAGLAKLPEFDEPMHHVIDDIPPGVDPAFDQGAIRHWYFHPSSGHLRLIHATDLNGGFIEYYRFEDFTPDPSLGDKDFDPVSLWGEKKSNSIKPVADDQ